MNDVRDQTIDDRCVPQFVSSLEMIGAKWEIPKFPLNVSMFGQLLNTWKTSSDKLGECFGNQFVGRRRRMTVAANIVDI